MKSNLILPKFNHIYFIGIGGIGMSGLAKILIQSGHEVSGSDLSSNKYTDELVSLGCSIYNGHSKENINNAGLVVCTSAISEENEELRYAIENNISVLKRSELLKKITTKFKGISVVGSHGKTTTSSLITWLLEYSKLNPSFIVGGLVKNLNTQSRFNESEYLVYEADESDGSFKLYKPEVLVLTNLDNDHMDFYKSIAGLVASFQDYLDGLSNKTKIIYNYDDPYLCKLDFSKFEVVKTFGSKQPCDLQLLSHKKNNFNLLANNTIYSFNSTLRGPHNIQNMMAALLVGGFLGVDLDMGGQSFSSFEGAGRRLDLLYSNETVQIYDDYAHHPTEIKCTIEGFCDEELYVFFQPHRYSRTIECWDQYLNCFNGASKVFVLDIYDAGEAPIEGIDAPKLVEAIVNANPGLEVHYCQDISKDLLLNSNNKVIEIFMGAGSISSMIRGLLNEHS